MTQRVVYLPIEIKHRELPSRLLIAAHLLEAGCTVVLGNHWSMTTEANLAALPDGIFLFKTMNKIQGRHMAEARRAGHVVAASDEEVLVFTEHNGFMYAFAEEAGMACELFFAQSEAHKEAVESRFPTLRGKVHATGNPRISLMSPALREAFGAKDQRIGPLKPYILFNTNYATINSIWNKDGAINMSVHAEAGAFDGPDRAGREKLFFETVVWEQANHKAMLSLMQWAVSNIKGLTFVIRPHPGERAEYWQKIFAGAANARVITQSDPHPWVLGAELLVHTGCTTGLEAALLGTPAVNLMPSDRPGIGQVTNFVNATVRTPEDAARAMAAFLSSRQGVIAANDPGPALDTYLPGHGDTSAARKIADTLVAAFRERGADSSPLAWRGIFADPERTALQKEKFTATEAEVMEGFATVAKVAGIRSRTRLAALGDSLFMLAPG